jgi:hypothetical protein
MDKTNAQYSRVPSISWVTPTTVHVELENGRCNQLFKMVAIKLKPPSDTKDCR